MTVTVMMISGGLAGLAGASQIGDFSHALDPIGLQDALYGYTGIVVAALAGFRLGGVIVTAVFLGGLSNAGFALQGHTFPNGLVGTIDGILLFCVLGSAVFTRYSIRLGRNDRTGQRSGDKDELPPAPTIAERPPAEAIDTATSG
jgi:simple sugar transport system permease protein